MNERKSVDIVCTACGADTFIMRKPRYEGFNRVGDSFTCAACGHEYANEEEVPFKEKQTVRVFTDADRPSQVKVFKEGEAERICRHCANYVVNPFMQWCSVHKKEVEATDSCPRFKTKPQQTEAPPLKEKNPLFPEASATSSSKAAGFPTASATDTPHSGTDHSCKNRKKSG
jgi:transposase-like protein